MAGGQDLQDGDLGPKAGRRGRQGPGWATAWEAGPGQLWEGFAWRAGGAAARAAAAAASGFRPVSTYKPRVEL